MSISAEGVTFDADQMWVRLSDGRTLGMPLAWFPRLPHAGRAALEAVEVTPFGLHGAEERPENGPVDRSQRRRGRCPRALDEEVSVAGLLAGRGGEARPDGSPGGAPVSAERPAA